MQSVYDAWARGEFPSPRELLAPEIEYVNPPDAVEPGTRRGFVEFSRAVEKTLEGWESWEMQPESFQASAGRVAVVVRYRARGRGSGVVVEGRESALWSVRDGRVTRYEWFHGPNDAIEELERGR